ncbi:MAG: GNAT family N-acetyltransferase [Ornithinimicrobium sp.]
MPRNTLLSDLKIRPYRNEDADGTLDVFLAAVTITAAADYSEGQIAAWSGPSHRNTTDWDRSMTIRDSYVAVLEDEIVGFSDVNADGYIDMLFVSPRHTRRGIARSLLTFMEIRALDLGAHQLWANVSRTARPLFERHGFAVQVEQHPVLAGVQMTNFRMLKSLKDVR